MRRGHPAAKTKWGEDAERVQMPGWLPSTEDKAPRRFAASRWPWTVILKDLLKPTSG